jgi:hypothetical protein
VLYDEDLYVDDYESDEEEEISNPPTIWYYIFVFEHFKFGFGVGVQSHDYFDNNRSLKWEVVIPINDHLVFFFLSPSGFSWKAQSTRTFFS